MPELPEVEIVKRGLEGAALHKKITGIIVNRIDLRFPVPRGFAARLEGGTITSFTRRGKYILCFTHTGAGFLLHLGMSGVVKIIPPDDLYKPERHDHLVFKLRDGGRFVFQDPRRFGFVGLTHQEIWQDKKPFVNMGPEPLGNHFNGPVLAEALKGRRGPIKTALLDQGIVAGVGNIYACEALYAARISPKRMASSIKGKRAERLAEAIIDVLNKAIESGGSSLKDYYHTDGSLGYFQHQFAVYDREGETCAISGGEIKRIVQSGRSTFYCPKHQR